MFICTSQMLPFNFFRVQFLLQEELLRKKLKKNSVISFAQWTIFLLIKNLKK